MIAWDCMHLLSAELKAPNWGDECLGKALVTDPMQKGSAEGWRCLKNERLSGQNEDCCLCHDTLRASSELLCWSGYPYPP